MHRHQKYFLIPAQITIRWPHYGMRLVEGWGLGVGGGGGGATITRDAKVQAFSLKAGALPPKGLLGLNLHPQAPPRPPFHTQPPPLNTSHPIGHVHARLSAGSRGTQLLIGARSRCTQLLCKNRLLHKVKVGSHRLQQRTPLA